MSLDERLTGAVREIANTVPVPEVDLAAIRSTARANHRRTVALAAAALVAVGILGASTANSGLFRAEQSPAPAEQPPRRSGFSPTDPEWTPERIRDEGLPGDPQGTIPANEADLTTALYEVCDGTRCDWDTGFEDSHVALEVSQQGRSAVFDMRWNGQPWVRAFDEDSVLVQDGDRSDQPPRYRLLQADGTAVLLRLVADPAPAVPGPGVVMIDDWTAWNGGMAGAEELYVVDDRAGTLRPVDAPEEVRYWGPDLDEFIWGLTSDCRVFTAAGGDFELHALDCADDLQFTYSIDTSAVPDWQRPGRMAVGELSGDRTFLHISLDHGITWQRIPVPNEAAIPGALRELG